MTAVSPGSSQRAVVEAALVLLERMGLSPADLAAVPQSRKPVPTFAAYVPVVSAAVSDGTRRAYGSYWNRVVEHWGGRRLDETWGFVLPKPSQPAWLGLSPVIWLILAGGVVLVLFFWWENHRLARGRAVLLDPALLRNPTLRGGLVAFFFH